MQIEWWKVIINYENYMVSNFGRVKSLPRLVKNGRGGGILTKERILKTKICRNGYEMVCLCKNSRTKWFLIHRLVAEAFIPNPDNLPEVNHKDENKLNNFVDNLEWCDHNYNINYGTCRKRISKSRVLYYKNKR